MASVIENTECKYCKYTCGSKKIYKVCGREKCWENIKKKECVECECKSNKKLWVCEECFLQQVCPFCGHSYRYTGMTGVFWRECFCI